MATLQTINIGNLVNDGTGDDLRTAFEKVNANFADLNDELTVTVTNAGSVGAGIFKQKTGSDLQFKRLVAGTKIVLTDNADNIEITNTAPDAFIRFDTDSGSVYANTHQQITLEGASAPASETGIKDIEVTAIGSTVRFKNVVPVTEYLTTYDFGTINGSYENAIQLSMQMSNADFGTLTLDSDLNLDCGSIT
jgi:hypothetical protein